MWSFAISGKLSMRFSIDWCLYYRDKLIWGCVTSNDTTYFVEVSNISSIEYLLISYHFKCKGMFQDFTENIYFDDKMISIWNCSRFYTCIDSIANRKRKIEGCSWIEFIGIPQWYWTHIDAHLYWTRWRIMWKLDARVRQLCALTQQQQLQQEGK